MILIVILASGCWDRIEIDERGFVIGIAIDALKKQPVGNEQEDSSDPHKREKFVVTYQMVIPSGLKQSGASGSGGSDKAYFNLTLEGDTLASLAAKLASKTSRAPFFEHLQVVLISEDVARQPGAFADVIDFFLRDSEMRRSLKIMVAKGNAKDVLDVKPMNENLPVRFIVSAAENMKKSARMLAESRLGEVHENLLNRESYLIQVISATEDRTDISIIGSALFDGRTNRLIGFIGGEDTAGVNFITGTVKGGVVNAKLDHHLIGYTIGSAKRTIHADVRNPEQIIFHIHIKTKGTIEQSFEQLDLMKEEAISMLEKKVAQDIQRITHHTIDELQQKYGRDVLELGVYLYQSHYRTWEKVDDDWELGKQFFRKAKIEITVDSEVQRTGSVLKSERNK